MRTRAVWRPPTKGVGWAFKRDPISNFQIANRAIAFVGVPTLKLMPCRVLYRAVISSYYIGRDNGQYFVRRAPEGVAAREGRRVVLEPALETHSSFHSLPNETIPKVSILEAPGVPGASRSVEWWAARRRPCWAGRRARPDAHEGGARARRGPKP